ncbi:hypothetical protein CPB84DRAFT_1797236 [Gymnopilus junonius]|uniref:Uncharacterized protein n=1 Tax=Gymnopilus junonius TaxID=109634 RepID=A0A9P5NAK3_GYMJU|nr:hypothetical protein CPB84DRAFT_1797236 [Gymnopilus junonius]
MTDDYLMHVARNLVRAVKGQTFNFVLDPVHRWHQSLPGGTRIVKDVRMEKESAIN